MAGARGQTEAEFRNTLHVSLPNQDFHRAFGSLILDLQLRGRTDFELDWACRNWVSVEYPLLRTYIHLLKSSYGVTPAKFNSNKVADEINTWVKGQTRGKVDNVIKPEQIDPYQIFLLVNAIYFEGKWENWTGRLCWNRCKNRSGSTPRYFFPSSVSRTGTT